MDSQPALIESRADLSEYNHWVDEDDVDGPTWCGMDSRNMPLNEDCIVDCPICIAVDRGEL